MRGSRWECRLIEMTMEEKMWSDSRLTKKEKWFYIALLHLDENRYNHVNDLYKEIGIGIRTGSHIANTLSKYDYIKWQPRNPDGKFYILL